MCDSIRMSNGDRAARDLMGVACYNFRGLGCMNSVGISFFFKVLIYNLSSIIAN